MAGWHNKRNVVPRSLLLLSRSNEQRESARVSSSHFPLSSSRPPAGDGPFPAVRPPEPSPTPWWPVVAWEPPRGLLSAGTRSTCGPGRTRALPGEHFPSSLMRLLPSRGPSCSGGPRDWPSPLSPRGRRAGRGRGGGGWRHGVQAASCTLTHTSPLPSPE